ncbi:Sodium/hydrogen exchanger family-domain-containing protein [Dactylonectria estremocensis]|uniref:Sodium/hydrogen exchanger family-domain-containing protein n=1 Tax=Dactylonectria estremocensis TaxID=1079267 RepID=A0A9P9F8E1_9HYPO|nr:Sodium/hydrogen exchanger family-domain-containing protein [Dactylonectria estremocensis]
MPSLEINDLNIVLGTLGAFLILYGIISVKIKQVWYLGVALPAVMLGIILRPVATKFIDSRQWGHADEEQTRVITLGVTRVMIGLQLVIAGYQLPSRYPWMRSKEVAMCLLPVMTMMWLSTTLCMLATTPELTLLPALVIASCVTCTDPVLSQAIAKGPFADMFVARPLREIMSCEAGANDGFAFPFLMIAVYMMRHAQGTTANGDGSVEGELLSAEGVGRVGGGIGVALREWFLETWLYIILLSVAYGIVVGYGSCKAIGFCLKRTWIDNESYLIFPSALGMFIVGTCGAIGTDDSLACFVAGCALNWDGEYLQETQRRHDEVNQVFTLLLNFGGFFYVGTIIPWSEFHDPVGTGITIGRLILLGFMVLFFRRIPAVLAAYKLMTPVCANYKEALFMGYFGPIGAGSVFYVEYARHLFPDIGDGDEEETRLMEMIGPIVYWLVLFSIVVHGLSIPALDLLYRYLKVKPIHDDAIEMCCSSLREALPANATMAGRDTLIAYNRFSRPIEAVGLPIEAVGLPTLGSWRLGGSSADDPEATEKGIEREEKIYDVREGRGEKPCG